MFGWLTSAVVRASCANRARRSASVVTLGGEHLQRDRPIEARVARAVDVAHAAGGEEAIDLVGSEPVTGF